MSLRDQLKEWGEEHEVEDLEERARAKAKAEAEARAAAEAAEARAEEQVSDEELFLQAVEGVERGEAILRKYDRSDPGRDPVDEEAAEEAPEDVRDKALFLQFVEEMGIDKKG